MMAATKLYYNHKVLFIAFSLYRSGTEKAKEPKKQTILARNRAHTIAKAAVTAEQTHDKIYSTLRGMMWRPSTTFSPNFVKIVSAFLRHLANNQTPMNTMLTL